MKAGLSIEPIKGMPIERLIASLRMLALNHVEFSIRLIPYTERMIPILNDMSTTLHLPIYGFDRFDFGSFDSNYEITIAEIISFVNNNYKKLNMKYTLSHPPEGKNSSFELLMERLEQLKTPIVLENIIGMTDQQFMDFFFKAKDHLGRKLAGHAIDAPHRYVQNWRTWLSVPKDLAKEIVYVHISDCTRTEDSHRPLGLGEMPYELFFDFLRSINYDGVINQEIKPHPTEIIELLYSCLRCVQPFSKRKAIRMRVLLGIIKPLVQWQINTRFGTYKDYSLDKLASELVIE